jgi:hypothetical protein
MSSVSLTQIGHPPARKNASLTMGAGFTRDLLFDLDGALTLTEMMTPEARTPIPKPNVALLQVNKQVRDEAFHYAWIRMRKQFFGWKLLLLCLQAQPGPAAKFAFCPQSPDIYGYLSKVELNLSNTQFLEFFGVSAYRSI